MRVTLLLAVLISSFASDAMADKRAALYGKWGTPQQCARAPIKAGGTVLAEPFEIGPTWLKQGQTWCDLNWGPVEVRKNGFFTAANALCGEDALRRYFLGVELHDDTLRLRWGFPHLSQKLSRCPNS